MSPAHDAPKLEAHASNNMPGRGIISVTSARIKSSATPDSIKSTPKPIEAGDDVDLQGTIRVIYSSDYNIGHLHVLVKRKLRKDIDDRLANVRLSLTYEEASITRPQTALDRRISLDNIGKYKAELDELSGKSRLQEYELELEPIVKQYASIGPSKVMISFDKGVIKSGNTEQDIERQRIIGEYFKHASKYIEIEVIRELSVPNTCNVCAFSLDDVSIEENGIQECPVCGVERYINLAPTCVSTKNEYQDRANFLKAFKRHNGQQTDRTTPTLFQALDDYFARRGMPTSDIVKAKRLDRWGKRQGSDLPMLIAALQATGNSDFYEDYNLIGHKYWGWSLPNVSSLEEVIMSDYDKTQKTYNLLVKERTSSLPTQFRLFKHLQLRSGKDNVRIEDFKLAGQRESLEFCDAAWREMCERANDDEIYFISTL